MKDPRGRLSKALILWFGALQTAHTVALVRALLLLPVQPGFPFPAPPPAGGWSEQARHFLIANGIADAGGIAISLLFVYGYFSRKRWSTWAGVCSTTALMYSAAIFAYGTLASGAWEAHPGAYLALGALFAPLPLLWSALAFWSLNERE